MDDKKFYFWQRINAMLLFFGGGVILIESIILQGDIYIFIIGMTIGSFISIVGFIFMVLSIIMKRLDLILNEIKKLKN